MDNGSKRTMVPVTPPKFHRNLLNALTERIRWREVYSTSYASLQVWASMYVSRTTSGGNVTQIRSLRNVRHACVGRRRSNLLNSLSDIPLEQEMSSKASFVRRGRRHMTKNKSEALWKRLSRRWRSEMVKNRVNTLIFGTRGNLQSTRCKESLSRHVRSRGSPTRLPTPSEMLLLCN